MHMKTLIAALVAVTALTAFATTADAHPHHGRHHHCAVRHHHRVCWWS
jgi:hypothetical protein